MSETDSSDSSSTPGDQRDIDEPDEIFKRWPHPTVPHLVLVLRLPKYPSRE